jgi:phosphate transport system substrate-binding protein
VTSPRFRNIFSCNDPVRDGSPLQGAGFVEGVVVRNPAPQAMPWRALTGALAALAVLLGLGVAVHAAAAEAPSAPEPAVLRIVAASGDKAIFDRLFDEMKASAGPAVRPELVQANALAAFRAFCQEPHGLDAHGRGPDILLTMRRISSQLVADCAGNDAAPMAVIELGRGALVLAMRSESVPMRLTSLQVYLALARDVPYRDEFRRNTAIRWSDIDRALPAQDIRFQLPPREDGSRAMFEQLVQEAGCRRERQVKLIFSAEHRTARCVTTRVDRVREIPREQAVRALLEAPEGTVGVLSYLDVAQSGGKLVAITLDGVEPTADSIVQATYDVSASYWLYARRGQPGVVPAVEEALARIATRASSEAVIGPGGLLAGLGLVPLLADERAAQRAVPSSETRAYGMASMLGRAAAAIGGMWGLTGISYGELNPSPTAEAVDLTTLMDIAGYKVQELETTFGIIPGAGMTFGIAREMSAADQEYLERTLYRDARRRPNLLSAIQRRIVRTIIDVSSTDGYAVSKVDISLFPLPGVRLVVTPGDAALSSEATTLMRAIERVQDRITETAR